MEKRKLLWIVLAVLGWFVLSFVSVNFYFGGPMLAPVSKQMLCAVGGEGCGGGGIGGCYPGWECVGPQERAYRWSSCMLTNHQDCFSPAGQELVCRGGQCVLACVNYCEEGERMCFEGYGYKECGNYDSDDCNEWGGVVDCGVGAVCEGEGVCALGCVEPPAGLVSWWDGSIHPDEWYITDIIDGNHGNAFADANTPGEGFVGPNSLSFGSAGDGGYIQVPDADNLDVTSVTIEGWIKLDNLNGEQVVLAKEGAFHFGYDESSQSIACVVFSETGDALEVIASEPILTDEWAHIACIYDENTGELGIYKNGIQIAVDNSNFGSIILNDVDIYIGQFNGNVHLFDGLIDELSIYNRALSDSEIQSIYNAGSEGKCRPDCVHECPQKGLIQCSDDGSGWMVCDYVDEDNCREWGPVVDCDPGEICVDGDCI